MKNRKLFLAAILLAVFPQIVAAQSGGNYTITQSVIASGGGQQIEGGNYSLEGTIGQPLSGTNSTGGTFRLSNGFWAAPQTAPTAATVTISGRVFSGAGTGIIRNVRIHLIDTFSGIERITQTSISGNYRFEEVEVGRFYVIRAESKNFVFSPDNHAIQLNEAREEINFTGWRMTTKSESSKKQ
ncbi:MAG TPA: carboxypeptidase-like regulatory domain-containing protein [Pyrinomonadaceae bacterium]|nr:carboxypeptidase-like regulatory domain-containing protein [Pyrinomonadaceae bacterium]